MNVFTQQSIMPVITAFQTLDWMPIALNSFWEHFPHFRVLVVDNNPCESESNFEARHAEESDWLQRHPYLIVVRQPHTPRTHGRAIDCAMQWCRENEIDCMLHIEPDCFMTGTQWYEELCRGLDQGASMSGSHRKLYGPIHPTPSLWRVADCHSTFDYCDRAGDERHPCFSELFDRDWLLDAIQDSGGDLKFWETQWDTGQKAWFDLAKSYRDHHAIETDDFHHFWFGATTSIEQTLKKHPELLPYREYTYRVPQAPEIPISPVAQSLRETLLSAMRSLDGKRGALLNAPQHAEPFDHLAALGAYQALEHAGAQVCEVLPAGTDTKPQSQNLDFLFILDRDELSAIERVTDLLLGAQRGLQISRTILLARSWRADADTIQQLNALTNTEVWFCDATSFGIAQQQGLRQIRLVPNLAFGCERVPFEVVRGNENRTITHLNSDTWSMPGQTLKHNAFEACTYVGRALHNAHHVTTDRVDVHIACVMAGIPDTLVGNKDSLANSVYQTWTFRHQESRLESTAKYSE